MFAAALALGNIAFAHEGPPFPILMDVPAGDDLVSVWADPDIGEAVFYVVLQTPSGGPPRSEPTVSMWTEPVSGRLARATYPAARQNLRGRVQFEAHPFFDQRDMWTVGFRIEPPGAAAHELLTQVESTPPGAGAWDLLIYFFPFALVGVLWIAAMARRRKIGSRCGARRHGSPTVARQEPRPLDVAARN